MTTTKTYNIKPINTVKDIDKHFDWMYDWITPEHCPLKKVSKSLDVELINLGKYISTDNAILELDKMGYKPAPSNYVLGLGVQHPEAHKEHKYIVSLDKENIFAGEDGGPCFLCLGWDDGRRLILASESYDWNDRWWFAVIRKEPLKS